MRLLPPPPVTFARVSGLGFIDGQGAAIAPKGYNLGGWMFIEKFFMEPDPSDIAGPGVIENEHSITDYLNTVYTGQSVPYGGSTGTQFFADWRANFITSDDIAMIAADGATVVRVGVSDFLISDGRAFPILDNLIAQCKANGMMVVIDMATMPGCFNISPNCSIERTAGLWGNDANKAAAIATWVQLATRYRDEPAIFAYDLIGEPSDVSDAELEEFYKALITAIRTVDPNHILVAEGGSFALTSTVFNDGWLLAHDANSVYSVHLYRASGCNPGDTYADFVSAISQYGTDVIAPLVSHGRPWFIGEFGGNCATWVHAACDSLLAVQSNTGLTFATTYFTWKGLRPTAGGEQTKVILNINSGTTPGTPRYIWATLMDKLQAGTAYTQADWDAAFAMIKTTSGSFHFRTVAQGFLQDYFAAPV